MQQVRRRSTPARSGVVIAACGAAFFFGSASARANGRFPQASQLVIDPEDAAHLVARTTYGVVQSIDGGLSWRWTCESAVGYSGRFDPAIAIASGGALVAALPGGLSRTTDRMCTWERAADPLAGHYVIDVAVDRTDAAHVVAIAAALDTTQIGFQATYAESHDAGRTWTVPGALLPEDFAPATVDVAPSRPQRIYASGVGAFPLFGVIARSDDGGVTWTSSSFGMGGARAPYIAAVDPVDADKVYLRLESDTGDRLAVSSNGGTTWRDVFTASASLLGFALSPDGSRVAVGGPSDGVWVASTTDLAFTKKSAIATRCLTWTREGLYACGTEPADGFTIGLSHDDGASFAPTYRGRDLAELACAPSTTTGATCATDWPAVAATLGQTDAGSEAGADAATDASAPDANGAAPSGVSAAGGCSAGRGESDIETRGGVALAVVIGALLASIARRQRL